MNEFHGLEAPIDNFMHVSMYLKRIECDYMRTSHTHCIHRAWYIEMALDVIFIVSFSLSSSFFLSVSQQTLVVIIVSSVVCVCVDIALQTVIYGCHLYHLRQVINALRI